jgi:hypothetical protein
VEDHALNFQMPHLFPKAEAPALRKSLEVRSPHPAALEWDYSEWRFPQPGGSMIELEPPPKPEPEPELKRIRSGIAPASAIAKALEMCDRIDRLTQKKKKPRRPAPLRKLTQGDTVLIEHEHRTGIVLEVSGDRVLVHCLFEPNENPEPLHKMARGDDELLAIADKLEPQVNRWHLRKDLDLTDLGKSLDLPGIMAEQQKIRGLRPRRDNSDGKVWITDEERPGRSKLALARATPDAIELPKPYIPALPAPKPEGGKYPFAETGDLVMLEDGRMAVIVAPPATWVRGFSDDTLKRITKRMARIVGGEEVEEIYGADVKSIVQPGTAAQRRLKRLLPSR